MLLKLRRQEPRSVVVAAGAALIGPSITINGYSAHDVALLLPSCLATQEMRGKWEPATSKPKADASQARPRPAAGTAP